MSTNAGFDLARVREAIGSGRLIWRLHAPQRMAERGIERREVVAAIDVGRLVEDYPDDQPYPSGLVLGSTGHRPLHIVVALDDAGASACIITVYEPSPDRFGPDWKTRRRP